MHRRGIGVQWKSELPLSVGRRRDEVRGEFLLRRNLIQYRPFYDLTKRYPIPGFGPFPMRLRVASSRAYCSTARPHPAPTQVSTTRFVGSHLRVNCELGKLNRAK